MRLLALDQSSKTSGYAIFQDEKLIKYGKFTFSDEEVGQRLKKIRYKVQEIIEDFDIDEVAFEDLYMDYNRTNNVFTFKVLAEVFGVIDELLVELNIPRYQVTAASWKSSFGIKGKNRTEQKQNAQQFVINTYNIKPTQDEADAICIGAHIIKTKQSTFDWSD